MRVPRDYPRTAFLSALVLAEQYRRRLHGSTSRKERYATCSIGWQN
jgi:hypothetical protein